MNIKFLGKWSSHIIKGERNVSFILDDKIVFDFGPHTLESLLDLNIDPGKLETVAITHMHLDHFAGLPELLWYRAKNKPARKLTVLGPQGIKETTEKLMGLLRTPPQFEAEFEFIEDKPYESITPFRANHVIPDNGYRVEYGGKTIFYSGDTAYSENVARGAQDVDILLHEMTYTDAMKEEAAFWKHSYCSSTMRVFNESHASKLIPLHLTAESEIEAKKLISKNSNVLYPGGTIKL
ncbi:MAG: ribonuclease Z [Ferroplasma sp.]